MRAGDDVDRVELDAAGRLGERRQARGGEPPTARTVELLAREEEVGDGAGREARGLRHGSGSIAESYATCERGRRRVVSARRARQTGREGDAYDEGHLAGHGDRGEPDDPRDRRQSLLSARGARARAFRG